MRQRIASICALLLMAGMLGACPKGPGEEPIDLQPGGPAPTATLTGRINFEGTPPPNDKVQMSADPYCQMRASEYPTVETVLVSDGGLENVIVFVSSPITGSYPPPSTPVEVDQRNCHYIPHVFTMMTKQTLNIKNSDATLHNVHGYAEKNPSFNYGQSVQGMVHMVTFGNPEVPLPIRCDVHRWMGAFVGVFTHPFHTVSTKGGAFELKLPAGKFEITAWHEKFGTKTTMLEVKDNEKKDVQFNFSSSDKSAD